MEKDEEKLLSRRQLEKWIKIFLVFLAFVWICTIISKSIYVSGLPLVKTDTASKKYVEHIVETEGIVTAGGEIAVNTHSGLRVDKIYVRQGDEVKEGDVLFTIDTTDISDIISSKETELAKLQCNLSDVQVNTVIESQKKEAAILWAQEDYETADKETLVAKERAKQALDKAELELAKHLAETVPYTSDNDRRNAWDSYHDWVNRGYSIADKIAAKEREIRDLEEQLAELDKAGMAETGQSVQPTQNADNDADENIENKNDTGVETENENKSENNTEEESENETENEGNTDAKSDNGENANDTTEKITEENKSEVDEKRTELQNKLKKAKEELLALQNELTKHDREAVSQPDYSAEEIKYDTWQSKKLALEEEIQHAKENYNDISYAREVTLRQKLRDIANAQATTRADSTAAIYELDIKQIQTQLASLYSLQKQKGEIKAQNEGIISKVLVEVGGRTSDTAAVLLTDMQRSCQFKFSITKEQGKYIHLNDTIELKLNGQSNIEVTVDYVTENAQGGYDIACLLPDGMGIPGLSGNIRKTVQGEYHDLTLPVEAVFQDSNSYYLYTLNEKEGILGSEYYAEKIKVQVKDSNDRYVAIEGGTISKDTKVITYSTKELKQGESVRPQEK